MLWTYYHAPLSAAVLWVMGDACELYEFAATAPLRPPRCPASEVRPGAVLVLDNGSYQCRAGWAGQDTPRLVFRALQHRPKAKSLPDGSTIVGDFSASLLRGVDPTRSLVRSAFEGPVVACYDVQEAVFDHAFERLGCEGASVAHPVVCSEPLLAPPSSRARVAELLFETYGCPEVAFGADAAFAWAACAPRGHGGGSGAASGVQGSGLVLTAGHSSSLLLPVHAGVPLPSAAVRLEVGGLAVTGYLCDLLRAVAPEFGRALGAGAWTRAEELKHALCHVAGDYAAEAAAYAAGARASVGAGGAHNSSQRFAPGRPVRVQLPWTPRVVKAGAAAPTEEDLARREAHRKASGDRFRAIHAAKRAAKMEEKASEVQQLEEAVQAARGCVSDPEALAAVLAQAGYPSETALSRAAARASLALRKLRGEAVDEEEEEEEEEGPSEAEKYPLLGVSDSELTPEELVAKRRQKLLRGGELARARAREAKACAAAAEAQAAAELAQRFEEAPEQVLGELRAQRLAVLQRVEARRARRFGGAAQQHPRHAAGAAAPPVPLPRRGGEAQRERMRLMAEAMGDDTAAGGGGGRKRKGGVPADEAEDDDFGANDDDWLVYRAMEREGQSDSDAEHADDAALARLRHTLHELAPEEASEDEDDAAFVTDGGAVGGGAAEWNRAETHQVWLTTERVRAPELLFSPELAGCASCGLGEAVAVALRRAPQHVRLALLAGGLPLVLTGGCALLPGLAQRLQAQVTSQQPPGAAMRVLVSQSPQLDAWRGAAARAVDVLGSAAAMTRDQWQEEGAAGLRRRPSIAYV